MMNLLLKVPLIKVPGTLIKVPGTLSGIGTLSGTLSVIALIGEL